MTTDWAAFDACLAAASGGPRTVLKVAVFDDADYAYASRAAARYPSLPLYLSVGNPAPGDEAGRGDVDLEDLLARFRWLVDKVARDRWFEATVLPQLHVLAWGNQRGV
jgi:7-carboxy-7-deazaguanine synthase